MSLYIIIILIIIQLFEIYCKGFLQKKETGFIMKNPSVRENRGGKRSILSAEDIAELCDVFKNKVKEIID